ncbi:hypothetical protein [Sphingomonas sp. EC-HK361]|uniref:hypothetical protein n=1 Tax=Sphingomonas sp. EC-HK361 TaxID=2038397 RepID=UPI00125EC4E2|nr:hypothetical protein [Sphingomonas sp. EC-HK361]
MRISDASSRLLLASVALAVTSGCGRPKPDDAAVTKVETQARADAGEVLCARGDAPLAKVCSLARAQDGHGLFLTIAFPDGGFRRFVIPNDGTGIAAADGAERAEVTTPAPDRVDVAIGGDRFRLPATIAP